MSTTIERTAGRRRRWPRWLATIAVSIIAIVLCILAGFRVGAVVREWGRPAIDAEQKTAEAAGLRLRYLEWGPSDGRPLLLVHGTLAWSRTWRDIAGPLGERGWRVIAPDMPPFGYSDRPAGHDYSRAAGAGRILAFADAIGLDRFALVVHSYGGGAAIEAAFTAPQRVEALVLLDVALGLGQPPSSGPPLAGLLGLPALGDAVVASTFTNPLMIGPGLRDFIADDRVVTDERVALYRAPLSQPGTTAAVRRWLFTGLFADEGGSRAAEPANYKVFEPPVLVVWGRDDTVTPLDQGEAIAATFGDARLEVLDGVNHIPHVEKPQAVIEAIDGFLRAESAGLSGLRGSR